MHSMIRGTFSFHDQEGPRGASLAITLIGSEGTEQVPSHPELKQIHCEKNKISASIGTNSSRTVLWIHMKECRGLGCPCSRACEYFLDHTDDVSVKELLYDKKNQDFLIENVAAPYQFVIFQGSEVLHVRVPSRDLIPNWLTPGNYTIW